jgi:hypothetical protein
MLLEREVIVAQVVKILPVFFNSKVHYRINKNPSLALSCERWIQSTPPHYFFDIHFILSFHMWPGLLIDLFLSGFPIKPFYAFLVFLRRPRSPCSVYFNHSVINSGWSVSCTLWSCSVSSCHFVFRSSTSFQTPLNLLFPWCGDQVSYAYRTTGKVVVFLCGSLHL